MARNVLTLELLSESPDGLCPSVSLGTVPADVLDLVVIGLYPINDQLAESLHEFLSRTCSFLEDTVLACCPFTHMRQGGSTLWMTEIEDK